MDDLQDALQGLMIGEPVFTVLNTGPPYIEITNVGQLIPGKFYLLHDDDETKPDYDFIAIYNGFDHATQQLHFTILYKRSQKKDRHQSFTNPWVGINVRYRELPMDVHYYPWDNKPITKKDINRTIGVEVDPNFVIDLPDLSTRKHVYQSRDLDTGVNLQVFRQANPDVEDDENEVLLQPIVPLHPMDDVDVDVDDDVDDDDDNFLDLEINTDEENEPRPFRMDMPSEAKDSSQVGLKYNKLKNKKSDFIKNRRNTTDKNRVISRKTQLLKSRENNRGGKRRKSRRRTKRISKGKAKMFYGGATINFPNGEKVYGPQLHGGSRTKKGRRKFRRSRKFRKY